MDCCAPGASGPTRTRMRMFESIGPACPSTSYKKVFYLAGRSHLPHCVRHALATCHPSYSCLRACARASANHVVDPHLAGHVASLRVCSASEHKTIHRAHMHMRGALDEHAGGGVRSVRSGGASRHGQLGAELAMHDRVAAYWPPAPAQRDAADAPRDVLANAPHHMDCAARHAAQSMWCDALVVLRVTSCQPWVALRAADTLRLVCTTRSSWRLCCTCALACCRAHFSTRRPASAELPEQAVRPQTTLARHFRRTPPSLAL